MIRSPGHCGRGRPAENAIALADAIRRRPSPPLRRSPASRAQRNPAIYAAPSPFFSVRCSTWIWASAAASSSASVPVPSGLLSSTTSTWASGTETRTRSTMLPRFSRSLYVGIMTTTERFRLLSRWCSSSGYVSHVRSPHPCERARHSGGGVCLSMSRLAEMFNPPLPGRAGAGDRPLPPVLVPGGRDWTPSLVSFACRRGRGPNWFTGTCTLSQGLTLDAMSACGIGVYRSL